jgi:glutamate--cysteine ligase
MSAIFTKLRKILEDDGRVEEWFTKAYQLGKPHYLSSVDIRHSGYKLAPVDTNLFPAGFGVLSPGCLDEAKTLSREFLKTYYPHAKTALLIPENHTRNLAYLDNVVRLKEILKDSGLRVVLGSLIAEEPIELVSGSGQTLKLHPLKKVDKKLTITDCEIPMPDIVVVNNDLTTGAPKIIQNIEQPVLPPVGYGWYRRRKSIHFDSYAEVATRFGTDFKIDPWLISAHFEKCGHINFKEMTGLECMAIAVEKVLRQTQQKYDEYGITAAPYAFIKANSGTYGMGIMTVKSPEEVLELNKKTRNKMNIIKEGTVSSEVLVQEGVPTIDTIGGKVAEPMMYVVGGKAVGCTYRVNEFRDALGNLNAAGMTFKSACEADMETEDKARITEGCPVLGLIGRMAALAANRECYEPDWEI